MKQSTIKANFILNALLTVAGFLFPLISFPYVSRVLGPVGTGKVRFANSLVSYFAILAQLGVPTYGIRACAKVRDKKEELSRVVHELLIINLVMDAVVYFAFALAVTFIPRLREDRLLYVVVSATILLSSIGMEWLYKALEQYKYITLRSLLFKLIALLTMFIIVRSERDYVQYGFISIFASSASSVLNLFNARKFVLFKPVGNYDFRRHLKPVLVFFAMACATTIYTNLDVVMLGFMKTDIDVGYYDAAVKVKTILVAIVTSLGTVILPRASYYIEKGEVEKFRYICKKALHFVILFATPLSVYFILFARYGIYFLSGSNYEGAVVPMQVIMPTLLLIGISNILGIQILVPTGREKVVLYSEIIGAALDLIINALLIPKMASTGAAIGTVVAELSVLLFQLLYVHDEIKKMIVPRCFLIVLAGVLISVLASYWVVLIHIPTFVTLAISAILFFGVYCGCMLLNKDEIILEMVQIVKKKMHK